MVVNPEVTRQIKYFSDRDRGFVIKSYNNRQKYMTEVSELFRREGIPTELINVAAVESAFDVRAHSHKGASGIWQFMKPTARSYDLTVNLFRDERRDPIKSSWAAARHLGDLYDEFGDWNLALAAYNAGGGTVRKAIKRGNSRDFWRLARGGHFKRQTIDYVPRVIAMSIIMKELNEYGFVEVAGLLQNQSVMLSYNK
jgi:membrane-bound lytic murein transglycosylase D